ncbi:MAG: peptide deformylase [Bacteroidota bacterium]
MKQNSDVLEEFTKLEIFIHWPSIDTTKQEIESLLDENFWEVGASGKRCSQEFVLRILIERTHKRNNDVWINKDFHCSETVERSSALARCFQHEIDHLDGILYIDRMKEEFVTLLQTEEQISVKELRKRSFEKIE